MKKICFALIIIVYPYSSIGQEANWALEAERTYEGEYYSFSIRLPREWFIVEDIEYKNGISIIFEAHSENSSFLIGIIDLYEQVDVTKISKTSRFDFDKYFNENPDKVLDENIQMAKNNFDAEIIESHWSKFFNIPATRILFSWEPLPNYKVFTEYWQFIHGAIFYTITKVSSEKSTENEIMIMNESLATFRLNTIDLSEKVFMPLKETNVKSQLIISRVIEGFVILIILFGILVAIFLIIKYILGVIKKEK